jgi:hypothetical protein
VIELYAHDPDTIEYILKANMLDKFGTNCALINPAMEKIFALITENFINNSLILTMRINRLKSEAQLVASFMDNASNKASILCIIFSYEKLSLAFSYTSSIKEIPHSVSMEYSYSSQVSNPGWEDQLINILKIILGL